MQRYYSDLRKKHSCYSMDEPSSKIATKYHKIYIPFAQSIQNRQSKQTLFWAGVTDWERESLLMTYIRGSLKSSNSLKFDLGADCVTI